ncbi:hypothetical protein ACFVIY_37895 [Streptomyces sp. NPDC127166]|uniref:hypothetical protein n=1 Tax=Streptomyces sp. NPDC127166 TaxID=3345380 RepID=UPI0036434C18
MADTTRLLLALADRLDAHHGDSPMTQRLAEAQALRVTEAEHGPGAYSEHVEHHLLASLPSIEPGETRDAYAGRLRGMAGVSA